MPQEGTRVSPLRRRRLRLTAVFVAVAGAWLLNQAAPAGRQASYDNGITDYGPISETALEPLRAAWFASSRILPQEYFPAGALLQARREAVELRPTSWSAFQPFWRLTPFRGPFTFYRPVDHQILGPWQSYGPAPLCETAGCTGAGQPYTGRISAIATNPVAPGTLYIGSPGGGVWRTRDGGQIWTPLFDHMPSMDIGALALDPLHPATIFAGTGNEGEYPGYTGIGLFRSRDEGTHWSRVGGGQFDGCAFSAIKIHPTEDGLMVAAVSIDPLYSGPAAACVGGVYLSTDGGTTWTRWLDRSQVDDVAFGQARILPLGPSGGFETMAIRVFAGVHGEGLYRSSVFVSAGGGYSPGTWQPVGGSLPTSGMNVVRVAVAPSNPARVYTVMGDPSSGDLLGGWTSGDGGQSWTAFTPPQAGWDRLGFTVDPDNPGTFYLSSGDIWRLDNDGASITVLSAADKTHVDVSCLVFDTLHRLYAGTDGGLVRTSDDVTFTSVNGNLSIAQVTPGISGTLQGNGALAPGGPFLAGLQDNGTVQFSGTQVWHEEPFGGDGGYSAVDLAHPDTQYFSTQMLTLFKTKDGGGSATVVDDSRWGTEPSSFFAPVVMDTAHGDTLYAGTDRLYRSTDGAGSWHVISPAFQSVITAIAPAASDAQVAYVGTQSSGLEVTADGGGSWTQGSGLPDRTIDDLAVNPAHADEAWAAVGGFGAGHLFHTTDGGHTWTDVSGDLPDAPANAVVVDTRYGGQVLFVGTDVGLFLSTDGGQRWLISGGTLPDSPITDLLLDRTTHQLVAATYGRGIWAAPEHLTHLEFRRPSFINPVGPIFHGFGGR